MGLRERRQRETAAYVIARNGAWYIAALGEQAGDAGNDETTDAARSLTVAKRIARQMAGRFGFEGAPRWTLVKEAGRSDRWELEMVEVTEEYDGSDD